MAASPLPRWAPTPNPTRPLRRGGEGEGEGEGDTATHDSGSRAKSSWSCGVPFPFGASFAAPCFSAPQPAVPKSTGLQADMQGGDRCDGFDGIETNLSRNNRGAFLTWQDLWVTAVDARGRWTTILHELSGCARPGEVLAIMGPSGCGKTTLLDTLAGRLGSSLEKRGEILINGRRQKLAFGTSAYVTQENVLMSTLTVRESVYYSAQLQLPDSMSSSEKREHANNTIHEMGLSAVMDTRIGGRTSKGISGGQMKRLSICMEMLIRPRLLFLDEPTSGLDSAASYHVMSRITRLGQTEGMTILAVIHQPSSEVFQLFHGLCLLAAGKTVFFGSASGANEFFATNGFPCPLMSNPCDHFLRTINKDFDEESDQERLTAKPPTAAEAIETLVNAYKSSNSSQDVRRQIAEMKEMDGAIVKRRQAIFLTKALVLTRRSFVNMYRDLGYYWLRFAIYTTVCLCLGTIFYNVGYSFASFQARASMLMFIACLLTFMAIGGFPSFVEEMKIFRRERLNGHYDIFAFVISNALSATPYLVLIAVVPGAIAYYLTGLQRGINHFVYFALVLCTCTMLVEGLMMVVAAIVPDFLMGIITGAGIQVVMMLNGGFFRLPNDLPKPVWRYPMYYIAFHKYAIQGLYKNEFLGLVLHDSSQGNHTVSGNDILKDYFQVEMGYSKWADLAILCAMVLIYRVIFLMVVKIAEKVKPMTKRISLGTPIQCTHVVEQFSCGL